MQKSGDKERRNEEENEKGPDREGNEMKGFRKHIIASVAITAVFAVCALALSVSAVPVSVTPAQASQSNSGSSAVPVDAVSVAPAAEAPQPAAVEEVAQPAPAAAAPQPVVESDPVALPQQEDGDPQQAAPDKKQEREINPPTNLTGKFVPEMPPYVYLEWNPNNSNKVLDYFIVYREDVGGSSEVVESSKKISAFKTKKAEYKDEDIKPGDTYRYWVTAVAKWGEESKSSNAVEVATIPMDPPAPPKGVVAAAIDPGVSMDWEPNSEANLAGYNVYAMAPNGRWRQINKDVVSDNHYYYCKGELGGSYAVSAVNVFGIESEYTAVVAQATTPVIYEDNDAAVSVQGFWTYEYYPGASAGQVRVAGNQGEKLNFHFTGRQVKLITANYWTCGDANVYIDGELVDTVSMYSFDPVFQTIDVSVPGLKYGQHTLTVEVAGSGNPENEFNFVNVDAFEVR